MLWALLFVLAAAALVISLIMMLFKRPRRRARWVALASFLVLCVSLAQMVRVADEEARSVGFVDAADKRAAADAGIPDSAEWAARRVALKARAEAEKAEAAAAAVRELKATAKSISYESLAREPTKYVGQIVTFRGKVLQAVESGSDETLRINVTRDQFGIWTNTVYVEYRKNSPSEPRILEDDVVSFWGEFRGIRSYTAVLGNPVQIPHIVARVVEIAPASSLAPQPETSALDKTRKYARMDIDDFKVDRAPLKGRRVEISGFLVPFGEFAMLGAKQLDMTGVPVETKELPREQRRQLVSKCSPGCGREHLLSLKKPAGMVTGGPALRRGGLSAATAAA